MSTADELDVLLYAWLSEPEARRAELRFSSYFRAAFPAICRFIRSLHADPASAQDIAQQALIKLFNHLGKDRRAADERMRQAVSELRPLDFGALHVRRVESWRHQAESFRGAAVGFRASPASQGLLEGWKDERDEINGRIPPLVRQGAHFVGEVRARIGPRVAHLAALGLATNRGEPAGTFERQPGQEPPDSAQVELPDPEVERFAASLLQCAHGQDWARIDTALGIVGVVGFVIHTSTVRTCLPALAIPSNGLLYTIAKRQLLDRLRARRLEIADSVQHLAEGGSEGVLDELELEDGNFREPRVREADWPPGAEQIGAAQEPDMAVEARYRAFLEFLRAPLTRAEAALAAAAATGKAKTEQARVDSLRAKYDRVMAVLTALRESPQPSAEDIARRHRLTRNQVKYVIERIREEFNYFFPDLARETLGRRKRQGSES